MIIRSNYLVVSNHNNDVSWVPKYTNNYVIYDRSDKYELPKCINLSKVIKSPNLGFNLYDYFAYIVDNYSNLPECVIFTKGNVFPRHITQEYFDKIANNDFFTPMEDFNMHKTYWPVCFFSADGGFCEINDSWYVPEHQAKYFYSYNEFIKFCFNNPVIPRYTRFAPGANYIVPKENVLKLPKVFYKNLLVFVSHCSLPAEAHIIERALHTLWTCNFEISKNMLKPIGKDFKVVASSQNNNIMSKICRVIFYKLNRYI